MPDALTEFAPAKVNLCLHVTGRRADGYHLLDSLVVFAGVGDRLSARPAEAFRLRVSGPFAAGVPEGEENLVLRAARWSPEARPLALSLEKNLPPASGIGGGSSDAAAALRLALRASGAGRPPEDLSRLGADVPVCFHARAARMRGIGERLDPVPPLPRAWMVLLNPRVEVPTPAVFRALAHRENPPLPPLPEGGWPDLPALVEWLSGTRNDLEGPAIAQAPVIAEAREALAQAPGCRFARMSGSGATCFGLFGSEAAAWRAAEHIAASHPGWWHAAAPLLT